MNRMIFVNLPVSDLSKAKDFYTGLGFTLNPMFSDDECACVVISDTIYVMLLTAIRFRDFATGPIADAHATTEVINCLSAESRDEVDVLVARAITSGGTYWLDKVEQDGMYGHSFADPDGHAWEVLYMDAAEA